MKAQAPGREIVTTVVIPCHDDGEYLLEAVASVERAVERAQRPDTTELMIVNDGSTDARTLEVLSRLRADGCRILDREQGGLARARNAGIEAASGRYILPLDADNRLLPGYVQRGEEILARDPATGIVFAGRRNFGMREHVVHPPVPKFPELCYFNRVDACALFRKQVWVDCGGYDPNLDALEDWEFWVHALTKGWRFHALREVLFEYRVRPDSMLRTAQRDERAVRAARIEYVHDKHRAALAPWLGPGPGVREHPWPRLLRALRREWIRRTYPTRGVRSR